MDERYSFYKETLIEYIPVKTSKILVCGGGISDRDILYSLGYSDVTISNIAKADNPEIYHPYEYKIENAENLSYVENEYEYVIAHAVMHHVSKPHGMLVEMYRVASIGALCLEARDSLLMRLMQRLGFAETYEIAWVNSFNGGGGQNNSYIPNYIYRQNEREIEKTIKSYDPRVDHTIYYKYGTAISGINESDKYYQVKSLILKILRPVQWLFAKIFIKQQNMFAFYIEKPNIPNKILPWLTLDNGNIAISKHWVKQNLRQKAPRWQFGL